MEFATWEQILLAILVIATTAIFARSLHPRIQAILAGGDIQLVGTVEVLPSMKMTGTAKDTLLYMRLSDYLAGAVLTPTLLLYLCVDFMFWCVVGIVLNLVCHAV